MKRRRESLKQRLRIIERDGLRCGLDGCPVGGWPETQQAIQQLSDVLPARDERDYSVYDVIGAFYRVDGADRYRVREETRG